MPLPRRSVLNAAHWVLTSPVDPTGLASGHTLCPMRGIIYSEGFILPGKGKSFKDKTFGLRGRGPYPPCAAAWLLGLYIMDLCEIL